MGKIISLYELFQLNVLTDAELLEIGKKHKLEKIILTEKSIQILYSGFLFSDYPIKKKQF